MKKTTQNKLSTWFVGLSQSEQRLLSIGTVMITLALLWVLFYQPLTAHVNNQATIKNRLQTQLNQMQEMTGTVIDNSLTEVQPIPTDITFSSWVDQQLKVVNLQEMVNRTEPIDENSLSIWFQGVPFDQAIDWLQNISKKYAVQADQIDVNVVDSALGLTNIRMRLTK